MRWIRIAAVFVFVFAALVSGVRADSLDINLNGDAVRAAYNHVRQDQGLEGTASFLHTQNDGDVFLVAVHAVGEPGNGQELEVGVGGELLWIDVDFEDGIAIALGGFVRYSLPWVEDLSLEGRAYIAPDVISFEDTEKYLELGIRASYRIHERASAYAGWRRITTRFTRTSTFSIDSGLHLGLKLTF